MSTGAHTQQYEEWWSQMQGGLDQLYVRMGSIYTSYQQMAVQHNLASKARDQVSAHNLSIASVIPDLVTRDVLNFRPPRDGDLAQATQVRFKAPMASTSAAHESFDEMPLTDVLWDAESLHGLDWQDALVQHEAQFGECLDVDNKANFHLLTNGLPPHGNDSFLTEFDRDGANKLFNSLQHEVIWDEEMPSDIGTHENQVFGDFPSKVVVWDEELFHDDSYDGLLQQLALGGECWNGEKISIPLSPGNKWSDPFSDFESVKLDMTAQIDRIGAILTDVDHVKHALGATSCQVSACEFSESETVVLEIRHETIEACKVLTEMPCQEDTQQLVEQVMPGVHAVSKGHSHVFFDEISPNEMATTHLEQVVFMAPGVFYGVAATSVDHQICIQLPLLVVSLSQNQVRAILFIMKQSN
ncbi:unnamed protein product [Miscanthus lutarioriparius]|uniref:Uncharacterized protein n=1 Tax=Miscanthus lutarioriparius TaxID=422564 RepID=A0A811PRZ1_9POAL|nr:unnamed protein product [Miscanthus lutarioriparius]